MRVKIVDARLLVRAVLASALALNGVGEDEAGAAGECVGKGEDDDQVECSGIRSAVIMLMHAFQAYSQSAAQRQ